MFPELTFEFVASMKKSTKYKGRLEFKLGNRNRLINKEDMDKIMGVRMNGIDYEPSEYNAQEFWKQISRESYYSSSKSKAQNIKDDTLFLIHRWLAFTVFGRKESLIVTPRVLSLID